MHDYEEFEDMTKLPPIQLGMEAEDVVSKLRGIITARCETDYGMMRYAIMPVGDGKSLPDSFDFDEAQVSLLSWGIAGRFQHLPQASFPDFQFGAIVKDKNSPFQGRIITKHWTMNGCMLFTVQADALTKEGKIIYEVYNGSNLQIVRLAPEVNVTNPHHEEPRKERTGPPPTRTVRERAR